MTNLNLTFDGVATLTNVNSTLGLFRSAAENYGLEPYTSDGIREAQRILSLADKVERIAFEAKQNRPYAAVAGQLIRGDIDPATAVDTITHAEHLSQMNSGMHFPAGRLAINLRQSALRPLRGQDEQPVLDWLEPAFSQAVADAAQYADIVDHHIGTDPQRDKPGVRTNYHPWEPRRPQLRNRRVAHAWENLGDALGTVYAIAAIVHELRATGVISKPLTDTRATVWAQVWNTIPDGAFTGGTRPGRIREFYRCHRHQHRLELATAQHLDRTSEPIPENPAQIAKATDALHQRMQHT